MEIIRLEKIGSTNDYLLSLKTDKDVVAVTDYQSAGKGMGTNRWESEPGKNLLFSILVHPTWLHPKDQYLLSMAEALALYDVLSEYTSGITIKWPNDIYWNDRKISGTRIDGNIAGGGMSDMIIGTGININQEQFYSDAPNPVSLYNITRTKYDTDLILNDIISRFEYYYNMAKESPDAIHSMYLQRLYRRDGTYAYEDENGRFEAELLTVKPNGIMVLRRTDGTLSEYEFKQVKYIIQ